METFSEDAFEFREARIVCADKGDWSEGTGNLFGYEG